MASQDQSNQGDITDSSVQFGQSGRDLKQIQGDDRSITIVFNQTFPQVKRTWNDRQSRILAKMQEDVKTRLDFTLNDEDVLIPLRMKSFGERPGKASLKLRRKLKTDQQTEQELDLNEAIVQVFCRPDVRKKLLILGAPGAGKTTTLLTLAKDLLTGAIDNPGTVIPIVFELSTWKTGTIKDWLAAQLKETFPGLSIAEGQEWIKDEILLPLMDGLDELSLEQQQKCMAELNAFAGRYPHLVVCCRVQEYLDARVGLNAIPGQVCLELLSDEQIQKYLQDMGSESLWNDIQTSPDLQKMLQPDQDGNPGILRVPLLLSMAELVYGEKPFASRAELYEAYIEERLHLDNRRMEREFTRNEKQWAYESADAEPNWSQTRSSLAWMARQLKARNEVELLIERMQPSWLETMQTRQQYRLVVGFGSGIALSLTGGPIISMTGGPMSRLVLGVIVNLVIGSIVSLTIIRPVESFQIQMSREMGQIFLLNLGGALLLGSIFCLIFGSAIGLAGGLMIQLATSVIFSIIFGVTLGAIFAFKKNLQLRTTSNQGIWNSLQNAVWVTSLSFLFSLLIVLMTVVIAALLTLKEQDWIFLLTHFWQDAQSLLLSVFFVALFVGYIAGGGLACFQHLCLRIILTRTRIIPWNFARFLNYCTERRLLQRIGGRYRFLHRELLDHFANLRV